MFMLLFYILIASYLIIRGGAEAGFWSGNNVIQGFLMLASGVCLLLAQIL